MKQSKKLLSIFLAMLMLLGTVSVVGSAAKGDFTKSTVQYDSIDNAKLSAEQVAGIVLDMVDEMLAGIDLSDVTDITSKIPGLTVDLNSINGAFNTLVSNESLLTGSLVAGDGNLKDLDISPLDGPRRGTGKSDIAVVCALLDFLAANFGDGAGIENAVYGIGKNREDGECFGVGGLLWDGKIMGISLGFSLSEIINDPDLLGLGMSVNELLDDLPSFLKSLIFDLLMYGSYPYSSDGVNKEYSEVSGDFSGKSIEQMLSIILKNFLTTPQKYKYDENGKKVWDPDSYLISADKYNSLNLGDDFISENSLLDFVDKIIQIAYEDFGTVALNHDVKKLFMEAMEVEFVEVEKGSDEYKKIIADPDYIDVETAKDVSSVKNYFCNAQMWEVDGVWYFRDYVTRDVLDAEGNPVFDAEGNVKRELQHRFQRAEAYTANELYNIFNWNYEFTDDTFDFDKMIQTDYKSIIGSLNHILHVILEKAINPAYLTSVGITSIDQLWVDGGNENFNENVVTTAKFVIENFAFQFFGRNEAYVDLTTFKANDALKAALKNCNTIESLVAYIGLPLLADVLPQLVYDVTLFTPGLEVEQTAALLVREFLSDLTPVVNYDAEIFADPTLNSGRAFKEHSSAEWMDIVLNMGLDLAMIYLDNITNIDVTKEGLEALHGVATEKGVQPWKVVLEEIVDWAVLYIGNGDVSALTSVDAEGNTFDLSPNNLSAIRCVTDGKTANANNYAGNAFATLSTALNAILPLGFLCGGVDSDNYALDVELLFNKILVFVTELNLETLLGLFGRNSRTDNIFTQDNVLAQVLGLVNKLLGSVFGRNLFEDTSSVTAIVNQDNLAALLVNLIDGLSERGNNLLVSLLPTVAQFVPDWGGEQTFRAPSIGLDGMYSLDGGSRNDITFEVKNGSKRVWRGYVDASGKRQQDEQYIVQLADVKAYNFDGSASSYINVTSLPTDAINFGGSKTVKFNVSGVPASGALVRIDVSYTVTNGMTTDKLPGTYTESRYVFFSHSSIADYAEQTSKLQKNWAYTPLFADADNIGSVQDIDTIRLTRSKQAATSDQTAYVKVNTGTTPATQFGITYGDKEEKYSNDNHDNTFRTLTADRAAFEASGKKAGDTITWNVKIYAKESKTSSDHNVTLYLYSGNDLNALRELVDFEAGQMRIPADYDTSKAEWTAYATAFQAAFIAARQDWNHAKSACKDMLNFKKYYEDLEKAAASVDKAKKTETTTGAMINTLKSTVKSVEGELNGKDYRTYALYRWHRFYDVLKSARNIIELDRRAALGLETMNFNYSGLTANEVSNLVAGDKYEAYIKALFVAKTEEEALEAKNQYNNIRSDLAGVQMIDIANTNALLPALQDRLVAREGGVVKTYLEKEINSAKKTFTNLDQYSTMSKAAYETALANAEAAMNSDSQDTVFAAKYALQVARNNLRTSAQEADYEELLRLMDQAKAALAQPAGTYTNGNADLGAVVAALGYEVKDTSGNTVQLFPDSAMVVSTRSYDKHDQDEVDAAADALKVALAKLEFASFKPADNGFEVKDLPTGEEGEDGNAILEALKTKTVAKEQSLDAVKELVKVSNFKVEVSLDDKYTSQDESTGIFVGTGATITVFKEEGTVKIPVATIKVVVNGDVNGDGTIDVLDCMAVELATHGHTSFTGAYNAAANLVGDATSGIDINDLGQVVIIAKG